MGSIFSLPCDVVSSMMHNEEEAAFITCLYNYKADKDLKDLYTAFYAGCACIKMSPYQMLANISNTLEDNSDPEAFFSVTFDLDDALEDIMERFFAFLEDSKYEYQEENMTYICSVITQLIHNINTGDIPKVNVAEEATVNVCTQSETHTESSRLEVRPSQSPWASVSSSDVTPV